MNPQDLIKELNDTFPRLQAVSTEEWDGNAGGIWFKGTDNALLDGEPQFYNAYSFEADPREEVWIMGVRKDLHEFLKSRGWFAEPYDSGTLMAWQ